MAYWRRLALGIPVSHSLPRNQAATSVHAYSPPGLPIGGYKAWEAAGLLVTAGPALTGAAVLGHLVGS